MKFPKTVQAVERHEGRDLWAIADAVLKEVGPPEPSGVKDGSAFLFKQLAKELEERGFGGYTVRRLREYRATASAFRGADRIPTLPFVVHEFATDPETLKAARVFARKEGMKLNTRAVKAYRVAQEAVRRREREERKVEADRKREEAELKLKEAEAEAAEARTEKERKEAERKAAEAKQEEAAATEEAKRPPAMSEPEPEDVFVVIAQQALRAHASEAKTWVKKAQRELAAVKKAANVEDFDGTKAYSAWVGVANQVSLLLHELEGFSEHGPNLKAVSG